MLELLKFQAYVENGAIPPEPPVGSSPFGNDYSFEHGMFENCFKVRQFCCKRGMWAIVDSIWTGQLSQWIGSRKCVEIASGAGFLAKALSEAGVDIIATDDRSWNSSKHQNMVFVHPVEKLDALEAVKKYNDRDILIMSWVPYESEIDFQAAEIWGYNRPIIYVGESFEGCTGSQKFWTHFEEYEDLPEFSIMAWPGIHDCVFIGELKVEKIREEY